MRFLGLEITKVPRKGTFKKLWNNSFYHENGRQIADMTPAEMRTQLMWIRNAIDINGEVTLTISPNDVYQRIRIDF